MSSDPTSISTNSATAIREILDRLVKQHRSGSGSTDGVQAWANVLGVANDRSQENRLQVSRLVHALVMPLTNRCRLQLHTLGNPTSNTALASVETYFYGKLTSSLGDADSARVAELSGTTSALAMIEDQLAMQWGDLPVGFLDEAAANVEELRHLLDERAAEEPEYAYVIWPLNEALDWALRGLALSKETGVLLGVAPAIEHAVQGAKERVRLSTEVEGVPPSRQPILNGTIELWTAVEGIGAVHAVATGSPIPAVIPIGARSLAQMARYTKIEEKLRERWARLVASSSPGPPALEAGSSQPQLGAGEGSTDT